ncbi:hypothetical protein Poli38472_007803 [Pythium oligandrum]|uniref:Secreted protein n=1 Tax=Pythium oligandrum TaxID=41045 RepID=A0A8K1FMD6_PYTOL|nr:hypothetical protein Poli38472_007803 [Pythium oligandrum]|eukprot:TMW68131.1 hypothetical protein Poli38472_007803 [Pythium oligandrum]
MQLRKILTLVATSAVLAIASTQASPMADATNSTTVVKECTPEQVKEADRIGSDPQVDKLCGKEPDEPVTDLSKSPMCLKPECLAYTKKTVLPSYPDCSVDGDNMRERIAMTVAACEAADTNGTSSSSASGTGDSVGASEKDKECTPAQVEEAERIGSDPQVDKLCGKEPDEPLADLSKSPMCLKPECLEYTKKTVLPSYPDCSVDGNNMRARIEMLIAVCEAAAPANGTNGTTPVPAPSAGVSLSGAASVTLVGLSMATLAMA